MSHKDFWAAFEKSAQSIRSDILGGNLRSAFSQVEVLMAAHGLEFAFELTGGGTKAVLVLTPEGCTEQAREIDGLLGSHPDIQGWEFFGRRQRKDIADAFTFVRHIYGVDASDVQFGLVRTPTGIDVTTVTSAIEGFSQEEANGLAMTLLDHLLGEEIVMAKVASVRATAQNMGQHLVSPTEFVAAMVPESLRC